MDHLYNSLQSEYKSPRGALAAGEPIRFALTIPEHYGFVEPRLVLIRDGGEPVEYRMGFAGCVEEVNHFRLTLTLNEVGLYFYYFDLYSDFRKLFRGALGEAVLSWTDGPLWQLTVYEKDFSTPEGFYNYYSTRYLIWANDAAKAVLGNDFMGEGPTVSPNFLMDVVFDACGWEGPAYMQATRSVMEQVPVMNTPTGLYMEDGNLTGTLTPEGQALVTDFDMLQYYYRKNFIYDDLR